MALLKAFHVSDVPILDPKAVFSLPPMIPHDLNGTIVDNDIAGDHKTKRPSTLQKKFVVMGHRGAGMNLLQSPDRRMKAIKENSVLAFNAAGKFNLDFIEFDVQVTKDDCPVIFHDNFILTKEKGSLIEKRVTDLTLDEFLSYGHQRDPKNVVKPLFRKTKDGRIFEWEVENDDCFCTLQEVFQRVDHDLGFNIEFKFDDNIVYKEEELVRVIEVALRVVSGHAKHRPIMFSSFQPDAALLIRKLQATYPVFFLTNGGSEIYTDVRRNSLDEAEKMCLAGELHGIVSEIKAILRNPGAVAKIHGSNLSLVSYGQLNNVPQVVYVQYLMGVDGVIVDLVEEITEAVSGFGKQIKQQEDDDLNQEGKNLQKGRENPKAALQQELSLLLKLIPEFK